MVSTEEKRRLIEQLIDVENKLISSEDIKRQFYDVLLRDTNGGKLYKYRTFDKKGYSLENLKEGTLHCSKPSAFNDPFDCKIGITLEGLYEAKYGEKIKSMEAMLEKFGFVVQGEGGLENCSTDEQRIFNKLLVDKELMGLFEDVVCEEKTKEEKEELLQDNIPTIMKMMQNFCRDEALKKELGEGADAINSFLKNATQAGIMMLLDDNATLANYASANGIQEDTDEIGYTISLGKKLFPELCNNINEFEKEFDRLFNELPKKIDDLLLVGCLCTDYKNRLMWSHYADSHTGFCIEYDFSEHTGANLLDLPLPVIYAKDRPIFPWDVVIDNNEDNMQRAQLQIVLSMLMKDNVWEYENEWRIFASSQKSSEYKMPKVSCIYLGVAISEENRTKIFEIASELNIPVKQMKVDRGVYDLHAEKEKNI